MSRFSNLELGGDSERQSRSREKILVKDEAYYLSEAQSAFERGEFRPALRHFSKVLEFNPNNVVAWTAQVRMLIELGEFQEATLWADKALERFPQEPELLAAKAVSLGRIGDVHGALVYSDASIAERGDTSYVWLARGDVLLAREESRADYCFEKALALSPHDWLVAWLAGRIRFFYKHFALALKLFQQAVELNAANFMLWLELGQCQQALGLVGSAKISMAQAKQLNPDCEAARLALVRLSGAGPWRRLFGWWRQTFRQ